MCITQKQPLIVDKNERYSITKITITLQQQLREAKALRTNIAGSAVYNSLDFIAVENTVQCLQCAIDNLEKISKH